MTIWNGAFASPLRKHRLYTGSIENHIDVNSITQLDADEEQELMDDFEDAESDLVIIGDGNISWLVRVGFNGDEDTLYEFVIQADEEPSEDEAKALIGHALSH
jgi:hypothetical protein